MRAGGDSLLIAGQGEQIGPGHAGFRHTEHGETAMGHGFCGAGRKGSAQRWSHGKTAGRRSTAA
jgi:hypothetical protein